jgi:hypothetical protein
MGPEGVDQIGKIVQISQGITVTGLLFLIVFAFYTNRVKTKAAYDEDIANIKAAHERELASQKAETDRERVRGDKWEGLSLDLLEKAATATQIGVEAVGELASARRGRR